MRVRILIATGATALALAACSGRKTVVADTDAAQNTQLDQINAATPDGAGRRTLIPQSRPASDNGKPDADAPNYGRALDAEPQPPKQ